MRLFLDQETVRPRLVTVLADLYPESLHVRQIGMQARHDDAVWFYARDQWTSPSSPKDADFRQRSFLYWSAAAASLDLRLGNCSTAAVELILRTHHPDLLAFEFGNG